MTFGLRTIGMTPLRTLLYEKAPAFLPNIYLLKKYKDKLV